MKTPSHHIIPGRAMNDRKINGSQYQLLGYLIGLTGEENVMWPNIKGIAKFFDVSERIIQKNIETLIKHGYVYRVYTGDHGTGRQYSNLLAIRFDPNMPTNEELTDKQRQEILDRFHARQENRENKCRARKLISFSSNKRKKAAVDNSVDNSENSLFFEDEKKFTHGMKKSSPLDTDTHEHNNNDFYLYAEKPKNYAERTRKSDFKNFWNGEREVGEVGSVWESRYIQDMKEHIFNAIESRIIYITEILGQYDVDDVFDCWITFWKKNNRNKIKNPAKAFYGFCLEFIKNRQVAYGK